MSPNFFARSTRLPVPTSSFDTAPLACEIAEKLGFLKGVNYASVTVEAKDKGKSSLINAVVKIDRSESMSCKLDLSCSEIRKILSSNASIKNLVPAVKSYRVRLLDVNHPAEDTVQVNNFVHYRAGRGFSRIKQDSMLGVSKTAVDGYGSVESKLSHLFSKRAFGKTDDLESSSREFISDDTIARFGGV